MFEYFVLLKNKPSVDEDYVAVNTDGQEYKLIDGNTCLVNEEINSSYVLDFYGEHPPENPVEYLKRRGFITGKYIIL